jgi:hypothetical protein
LSPPLGEPPERLGDVAGEHRAACSEPGRAGHASAAAIAAELVFYGRAALAAVLPPIAARAAAPRPPPSWCSTAPPRSPRSCRRVTTSAALGEPPTAPGRVEVAGEPARRPASDYQHRLAQDPSARQSWRHRSRTAS